MRLLPEKASLRGSLQAAGTHLNNAVKHCRWATEPSSATTHNCSAEPSAAGFAVCSAACSAACWLICAPFANDARTDSCMCDCYTYGGRYERCSGGSPTPRHRAPEKPEVGAGNLCVAAIDSAERGMIWASTARDRLEKQNLGCEVLNWGGWEGQTEGQQNSFA